MVFVPIAFVTDYLSAIVIVSPQGRRGYLRIALPEARLPSLLLPGCLALARMESQPEGGEAQGKLPLSRSKISSTVSMGVFPYK